MRFRVKSSKFIFFIFCILFTLVIVAKAWDLISMVGEWEICERTHYRKEGWNTGKVIWRQRERGFEGYTAHIIIDEWRNLREWWQIGVLGLGETRNKFYFKLNITDNDSGAKLYINTLYIGITAWFGAFDHLWIWSNAGNDSNILTNDNLLSGFNLGSYFSGYGAEIAAHQTFNCSIYVESEAEGAKVTWILEIPQCEPPYNYFAKTVNTTVVLGNDVTVTLIVEHDGQGIDEFHYYDSFTVEEKPYYSVKAPKQWWEQLGDLILGFNWWGITSFLMLVFAVIINIVQSSLPFLGIIVILYFLDVAVTSVTTGNFRLLGEFFMRIYDLIRGVIQTLINIAHAIYDFIHFW